MRYLSLFSGIEAASAAWHPLGWTCAAVAEIESFPCKVLAYHYPGTPNLGDITKITQQQIEALGHIDLVVFGAPCQDLSVAGKRKGMRHDDGTVTRSGLFYAALQIAEWSRARWAVYENVPGMFSSSGGADFASVVSEMAGAEFNLPAKTKWQTSGVCVGERGLVEWVTLDAQYCRTPQHPRAVPQRRRRVFVIRDSGNWSSRPPLFLDSESLRGNPPPSRETGKEVAGTISKCSFSGGASGRPEGAAAGHSLLGGIDYENNAHGANDATGPLLKGSPTGGGRPLPAIVTCMAHGQGGAEITEGYAPTLNCNHEQPIALVGNIINRQPHNGGNGTGFDESGAMYTLTKTDVHAVAYRTNAAGQVNEQEGISASLSTQTDPCAQILCFAQNTRDEVREMEVPGALAAQPGMKQTSYLRQGMQVRRLTPLECERLQGFPDFYTAITGASDSARYKSLGNSMALNCMSLLGQRIALVDALS